MKSVGQQLQEARLAKNWTPELAARETKIKADRVRDLEADDYTNFSSPTYARGFVRTYARALGLDEYRILRQLDNKLPEDDNASFAPENGSMPYVPEPSTQAMHVSSAPRTGLYVVFGLGCAVLAVAAFVLLQAYRAGELQRYFASTSTLDSATMNSGAAPSVTDLEAPKQALPVDPVDTSHSVRAQPVDLNVLSAAPDAKSPSATAVPVAGSVNGTPASETAPSAQSPATTTATPSVAEAAPVVASPVGVAPTAVPVVTPANGISPAPGSPAAPAAAEHPASEAENAAPVTSSGRPPPRALPVDPSELVAANQPPPEGPINPANPPLTDPGAPQPTTAVDLGSGSGSPVAVPVDSHTKRLILTASHDSFIRVTSLDSPDRQVLYASVLRSGQSLEFDGRKFSVNVSVPSAVDIMLDGFNYGPHSNGVSPETFTLESHQP